MKKEKSQCKNQNGFKFLVVVFSFSILLFNLMPVLADEPSDSSFVYLFHLYYDNGQLFADRDFKFNYDVIPEEFIQETYDIQFPFRGETVNFKNEVVAEFFFDPKHGDQKLTKGKVSVKAPYFADGQKVVFYNFQNQPLLTIFVSESSFCDDNGVCNSDRGEDDKTCPADCRGVLPTTPPFFEEPGGGGGQTNMLKYAIYVLIGAGAVLGGWFGWKWWKKRKVSQLQADKQFTSKLG